MTGNLRILALGICLAIGVAAFQNCSKGGFMAVERNSQASTSGAGSPTPGPSPAPANPNPNPMPAPQPAFQGSPVVFQQAGTPPARIAPAYAAFNDKLFVFGSRNPILGDAAIFDKATNTWTSVNTMNGPQQGYGARAVWTGTHILVWGGVVLNVGSVNTGYLYNPANGTWSTLPQQNTIPSRALHAMAWMNGKLFVYGGYFETPGAGFGTRNDGYVYDPATQMWSQLNNANSPPALQRLNAIFTGAKVLLFGGCANNGNASNAFYELNPANGQWSQINAAGAPTARCGHSAVWSGKELIVFGGHNGNGIPVNDMGAYDPATNSWRLIPGSTGISNRAEHAAGWFPTAGVMMVWGGFSAFVQTALSTGNLVN